MCVYFAFIFKNRNRETYFLSGLLFVISIRVAKSVFFAFSPSISNAFLHIGLTACLLIGPLLYLYVRETILTKENKSNWLLHILPVILFMFIIHFWYPYSEYRYLWRRTYQGYLAWFLFSQWLVYIMLSIVMIKAPLKKMFKVKQTLSELDLWLISVVSGVALIWLAYFTTNYTSYMVGAATFSFVLYLVILIIAINNKKGLDFLRRSTRYENKKIDKISAEEILNRIENLFQKEPVFLNSEFKVNDLAELLDITPHYLSQVLNDNLNVSFPNFINTYKIEIAKQMIETNKHLTIEAIGEECGFKSKTTFYKAFKKEMGITPAAYKRLNI